MLLSFNLSAPASDPEAVARAKTASQIRCCLWRVKGLVHRGVELAIVGELEEAEADRRLEEDEPVGSELRVSHRCTL